MLRVIVEVTADDLAEMGVTQEQLEETVRDKMSAWTWKAMPCISTILAYLLSWPSTENVDQDRYASY